MSKKPNKSAGYRDFYKQYTNHKASSKQRGIDFHLTYDQWLNIWLLSGKLNQRGKYVMCRFNDVGPYSVNNVYIDLRTTNSRDTSMGKPNVWTRQEKHMAVSMFLENESFSAISEAIGKSYHAVRIKIYRSVSLKDWQSLWKEAE